MTPWTATGHTCDQRSCPAPAQRTLLIYGQDFHFCAHHNAEIERALVATAGTNWIAIAVHRLEPTRALSQRTVPTLPARRIPQAR